MALILDGTNGLSDIDGSASTPAIRGTDTNTGIFFPAADTIAFANGGVRTATIDSSGNLLVGTTSVGGQGGFSVSPNATSGAFQISVDRASTTGNSAPFLFKNGGAQVGFIQYNNTTTTYSTSSDYRLKENIEPMTGALATVSALKPCTYVWKSSGELGQGFIAHELAEVVPDCVVGEKDAVETVDDLDAEGKVIGTKEVPRYQGIDTSFLVATLTSAIQELKSIVDAQAERIALLEAK